MNEMPIFEEHYKDWQTSNPILAFLQHGKRLHLKRSFSLLAFEDCNSEIGYEPGQYTEAQGLATWQHTLHITSPGFHIMKHKLMQQFFYRSQKLLMREESKIVPTLFQLTGTIASCCVKKNNKSIAMYLPNQINACRAGFYSRLNWEYRKKIIKAQSVSLQRSLILLLQCRLFKRNVTGGSGSERRYLKSTKPDKVLFTAILES